MKEFYDLQNHRYIHINAKAVIKTEEIKRSNLFRSGETKITMSDGSAFLVKGNVDEINKLLDI